MYKSLYEPDLSFLLGKNLGVDKVYVHIFCLFLEELFLFLLSFEFFMYFE